MALSPVPGLAAGTQAEDVFKQQYTCQSTSLLRGTAACLKVTGTDKDVVDPDDANAGPIIGLVMSGGPITSGAYGAPAANDPLLVQRFGRAVGLLATSQTIVRGDRLGVVASSGGKLGKFIPGGSMKFVGYAAQSKTTTATSLFIEVDLALPHPTLTVRQVTGGCTGAIGAATKYLTAPGSGVAAAQIPLYRARFAGETVRNLSVNLGTAPGGADTAAFTVQKSSDNGATWSDLSVTATISAAAKSATDLTNSAVLAAGDLLAVKMVSSAGTAAAPLATFDVVL